MSVVAVESYCSRRKTTSECSDHDHPAGSETFGSMTVEDNGASALSLSTVRSGPTYTLLIKGGDRIWSEAE
jgi:hypothetical protein